MWDIKLREARLTYDLGVWYTQNPSRDITDVESFSDYINPRTVTIKPFLTGRVFVTSTVLTGTRQFFLILLSPRAYLRLEP